jgi:lysophospholipase L1-like esterase
MAGLIRTTAVAAGCLGGLSTAMYTLMSEQSRRARRVIGKPSGSSLRADGVYLPDGTGPLARTRCVGALGDPIRLAMLGDSSAAGLGAETTERLPGVLVARGLAEETGRPVLLDTYAVSGSTTRDLTPQIDLALAGGAEVALAVIGANDVTHRIHPYTSAALLSAAVARLAAEGVATVVGTCPDLGTVRPIPQPLRGFAHTWSVTLARLQRAAVLRAGGHPVPLGDLLASEFHTRDDYWSADWFHPSGTGYEAAAAVLLPAVHQAVLRRLPRRVDHGRRVA